VVAAVDVYAREAVVQSAPPAPPSRYPRPPASDRLGRAFYQDSTLLSASRGGAAAVFQRIIRKATTHAPHARVHYSCHQSAPDPTGSTAREAGSRDIWQVLGGQEPPAATTTAATQTPVPQATDAATDTQGALGAAERKDGAAQTV
jgi:hypothetical protein